MFESVDNDQTILHDLLRDFMADELGEEGKIEAHRALLDAYRQTQTDQGWHTALNDGYLYDHLTYHLDQIAGHDPAAAEELKGLFADDAWLHIRVPQTNYEYDGYTTDLNRAWERAQAAAHGQIEADGPVTALADCVRYALIRTSINSLSGNYVPILVARALELNLDRWSPGRALSIATRVPEAKDRVEMVAALAPQLTGEAKEKALSSALAAASAFSDEGSRAQALTALAPHLTGDLLSGALAAASAISDDVYRVHALTALAPQLTGDLLSGALAAASAFSDEGSRAQALTALAPRLTGEAKEIALSAKIQALVDHLRNLENEGRSHLLVFLATKGHFDSPVPGVTPPVLNEVASHVIDICNEWEWL